MELRDKNNREVRVTQLGDNAHIYDKEREDPTPEERWKTMSRKEKLLYYKEYYLGYFLLVLVLLVLSVYVIYNVTRPSKPYTLFLAMFDGVQFEDSICDDADQMFGDYLRSTDYEGLTAQDRILFQTFYDTIVDEIRIDGFYDDGVMDVMIMRQKNFESFSYNHLFLDLKEVLPADLYAAIEDRIVYSEATENFPSYPCGILLKDGDYDMHIYTNEAVSDAYVAIPHNAKNIDAAVYFIRFLFGVKQ